MKSLGFADVEGRLVEAALLWRRTPASGFTPSRGSPFATDAPWHLLTRRARAGSDWEAWRVEIEEAAVEAARDKGAFAASEGWQGMGLTSAEVARRDEASEWLALVPDADRLLVVEAVWWMGSTGRRVDWARMMRLLGVERGRDGLRMRYVRAIRELVRAVNRRRLDKAA